ncbi:hypothetical protein [Massilia horti]|uniref:Transmembrane protein n=1 Tax=Massilia horti TaxID=2562153 RepID=A0A4Y9T8D7_9BURK|nr:hypothetical protein [Massilia horti]TFW35896.1 hypothetical protein E4O92_00935 [Massilia horti]
MSEISTLRLYLLRSLYLFIAVGLSIYVWPAILSPSSKVVDSHTVVQAMLGTLSLLSLLGLRYPLKMLPLLIFELGWKIFWIVAFALPMWLGPGLNEYARDTLLETAVGVVLIPLILPWGFIFRNYVRAPSTPWFKTGYSGTTDHPQSV